MTKDLPPMLVVAAVLRRGDGRLLVQQRPPGTSMAGLWEFPGGKLEPGEAPEAALARELDEELGIAVDPATLTSITFSSVVMDSGRVLILLLYGGSVWTGEPRALQASALRWILPGELRSLPMPNADRPFVDILSPGSAT